MDNKLYPLLRCVIETRSTNAILLVVLTNLNLLSNLNLETPFIEKLLTVEEPDGHFAPD
jgi:hypothetical protein